MLGTPSQFFQTFWDKNEPEFDEEAHDVTAKLAPHLKISLLLLYKYLYGLNTNKLAKDFTPTQQG